MVTRGNLTNKKIKQYQWHIKENRTDKGRLGNKKHLKFKLLNQHFIINSRGYKRK